MGADRRTLFEGYTAKRTRADGSVETRPVYHLNYEALYGETSQADVDQILMLAKLTGTQLLKRRVGKSNDGLWSRLTGGDYGDTFEQIYRQVCAGWPQGAVPGLFYQLPPARSATLVLSGGADPATPPRHAERVVQALGARARHVVVAQAGHGLLGIACLRDAVFRFIDAPGDDAALAVEADCAQALPRPPVFIPVAAGPVTEAAK